MTIMPAAAPIPTLDGDHVYIDVHRHTEPGQPDLHEVVLSLAAGPIVFSPEQAADLMAQLAAAVKQTEPRRACVRRWPHRSTR